MAITPEQMAAFMADEMMDDLDKLAESLIAFEERWTQYGKQYAHLVTPEKTAELERRYREFERRMIERSDD